MTTLTNKHNGRTTEVECSFPFRDYYKANGKQERTLVCEKASTLDGPDLSPETTQAAKVLFEGMSDADKQKTFRRLGVQETLERIGYEVELESPLCRKTTLLQNGKPVRS